MAKRKYRVLSRTPTLGTPQGEIVEVENKRLEAELVARGALERVKRGEETKEEEKDAETTRPDASRRTA